MTQTWTPDSWTSHEARQLPTYPDAGALASATATLANFPPLVFAGEARSLTAELAQIGARLIAQVLADLDAFREVPPPDEGVTYA